MLCFGCMQTGTYVDHKCPFTGNVAIRGRVLSGEWARPAFYFGGKALSQSWHRPSRCLHCWRLSWRARGQRSIPARPGCAGIVRTTKMKRTIIIRRDYLHYIRKYQRCASLRRFFGMQQRVLHKPLTLCFCLTPSTLPPQF